MSAFYSLKSSSSLSDYSLQSSEESSKELHADINRVCALSANILEAHTVTVYAPTTNGNEINLVCIGAHTLAPNAVEFKPINIDCGLIGWVAKNKKSIHVSPFERDSRVLGYYNTDLELKSLIGVPVHISSKLPVSAVMIADSKKSFAFSKIQIKIFEDLALEASRYINIHCQEVESSNIHQEWNRFIQKAQMFCQTSSLTEVAVVRIRSTNIRSLESKFGLYKSLSFLLQVYKLIGQALPTKYPIFITPLGEMIIVIDSMTTETYTNKILALTEYTKLNGLSLQVEFRARAYPKSDQSLSLEKLIDLTAFEDTSTMLIQKTNFNEPVIIEEKRRKILSFR